MGSRFVHRSVPARRILCAGAGATLLAFVAGCGQASMPAAAQTRSSDQDAATVTNLMRDVERRYVAPVGDQTLLDNALKGMVSRLDPHSNYLNPTEYTRLKTDMGGQFAGLGMQITQERGVPKVLAPIDGTPAAQAGIDPGDRIVRIDGKPTEGMDLNDVVSQLRGPIGTKVTLAIERTDHAPFDVTLTRAIIHVATVKSKLEANKIGYARISAFTETTQRDLVEALNGLQRQAGGKLNGFVLDLREDPGGELTAAIDVAGDFLGGGTVVTTRNRAGEARVHAASNEADRLGGAPMVVLIDGASASASEIVAGALQDRHRAEVLGTRSFGKGSVQSVLPVDTGGALVLTTELYFTPAGRSIQSIGIEPDTIVPLPKEQQVANPVLRETDLSNALKNAGALMPGAGPQSTPRPHLEETAGVDRPIKPDLIGTAQDAQLKAALDRLKAAPSRAAAGN